MRRIFLAAVCLIVGCNVKVPELPDEGKSPTPKPVATFNAAAAADELARQAELANDSPALKATEVLDGILNQAVDCGMDADFVKRVREACPAIGQPNAVDISKDQVESIRKVR